jgi:hypothetical protein
MTSHRQACSLSGTLKRCHFDANRKVQLIFFGIDLPILQSKMRKPNRRTIWTRRFPDFPRLYGQPAADCKRERKYVTGGLLNTEETTAVFFSQLVMNEVCFQLDVHAESKWNWDGEMQDVSICYKVHRSTGSISTVQSLQIIVDHRSKMQSQLFAHWNICLTGRKHDVLALQAL